MFKREIYIEVLMWMADHTHILIITDHQGDMNMNIRNHPLQDQMTKYMSKRYTMELILSSKLNVLSVYLIPNLLVFDQTTTENILQRVAVPLLQEHILLIGIRATKAIKLRVLVCQIPNLLHSHIATENILKRVAVPLLQEHILLIGVVA